MEWEKGKLERRNWLEEEGRRPALEQRGPPRRPTSQRQRKPTKQKALLTYEKNRHGKITADDSLRRVETKNFFLVRTLTKKKGTKRMKRSSCLKATRG